MDVCVCVAECGGLALEGKLDADFEMIPAISKNDVHFDMLEKMIIECLSVVGSSCGRTAVVGAGSQETNGTGDDLLPAAGPARPLPPTASPMPTVAPPVFAPSPPFSTTTQRALVAEVHTNPDPVAHCSSLLLTARPAQKSDQPHERPALLVLVRWIFRSYSGCGFKDGGGRFLSIDHF